MQSQTQDRRLVSALLWLGVFVVLWGVIERLGYYSITDHYSFAQIEQMRYVVHLLVLFAVCGPQLRRIAATRQLGAQIARGLCMFVMPAGFIVASGELSARNLWSVFWVMPLLVAALARWWLREPVPRPTLAYLAVGYVGVLAILRPNVNVLTPWIVGPVVSGMGFAFYVAYSRRLRDESLATSLFYTGLVALGCMTPFAWAVWQPVRGEDVPTIFSIGVVGLVALFSIDRALETLPAGSVAPLLSVSVVSEVALDALLTAQPPRLASLGGATLLLAVAVLIARHLLHRTEKAVERS